ncbi:adenylate/guanylate cyclase domain-containing protein [Phormidium sp. CCY1219]|uniref:adenylate/guanylate cyclase domain-containing protein n=1 Tax=Phormidium sp. CCY1219 TaxID=2886104 RepID=UPI002D1EED95|nr:adenylate/guanylate cyclase domain-containing protein [Phormidium sp. CCY1219]MEB3830350.1 CHASE domain-containing protein [Phormidium sp. CCY1219]
MPNQPRLPWIRYLPAAIVFGVGVGLSFVAFLLIWEWEDRRRDYEFSRGADIIASKIQRQLNKDLELIRNTGDFLEATYPVDRGAFERFVRRPLGDRATVQWLAWVERVPPEQVYEFEYWMRTPQVPDFQIRQNNGEAVLPFDSERSEYFPIAQVAPGVQNQHLLGVDLGSVARYAAGLELARETGEMVVTELLDWSLDGESNERILVILPAYNLDANPENLTLKLNASETPAEYGVAARNPENLQGFVVGKLNISALFDTANSRSSKFNMYLCDETPTATEASLGAQPNNRLLAIYEFQELVISGSDGEAFGVTVPSTCPVKQLHSASKEGQLVLLGDSHPHARREKMEMGGREWALYILPTDDYRSSRKHWRSWAVLIMGLLWTHIPVTYLLTSVSRTMQIEALATERAEKAEKLRQALQQLKTEQAKSERLLLNVLPKAIAERLKQDTQTIADSFPEVTVLFADIVGFTKLAARISPSELVQRLNEIFSAFDGLAAKHGLEKIKTIGDAYMVVGGLPVHRSDHTEAIAEMALDMQEEIGRFNRKHGEAFSMRIGIHTGPTIAGVIGTHKFIYDLWGDTVNLASRMESHGLPGRIQVSGSTYKLLREKYCFQQRGPIPIKGKGEMLVYLLSGRSRDGVCHPILALPSHEMGQFQSRESVEEGMG